MMAKVRLSELANARSGDKGEDSNVGVWANTDADYELLCEKLTAKIVKEHFSAICKGEVIRYELPNLRALNFILKDSLGGGGSASLKTDAQGKAHGNAMLLLELEV